MQAKKYILPTVILCLGLLLPQLLDFLGLQYLLSLATRALIYGLAASSLNLILGYGGLVSLGHAVFMGIGGYTAGILLYHTQAGSQIFGLLLPGAFWNSALIAWPLAIVLAALFALITGLISLRTRGMHFIMITLAFAQMVYFFFTSLDVYGGSDGISLYGRNTLPGLDLDNDQVFYYLCLVILLIVLFLMHRILQARFGRALIAGRENIVRLQALGIAPLGYQLSAYCLSGAVAGLAGALLVNQGEFVSPDILHWTRSGELMVMVLVGGMARLFGPVLGAVVLLFLEEYLAMYTDHWMVIFGPFLILVVLFGRSGLYGLLFERGARS